MANGQIKVLLPFLVVAVAVVVVVWPMNDWTVKWVERCVVDPNLSCQVQVKSLLINGRRSLSVCHMHTRGHFLTIPNHDGLQYAGSTTDSGSVLDVRFCCQFGRNVFATNYQRIPQFRVFFCFLLLSSISHGHCWETVAVRCCRLGDVVWLIQLVITRCPRRRTSQPATDLIPVHTRPDTGARGWEKPPIYF